MIEQKSIIILALLILIYNFELLIILKWNALNIIISILLYFPYLYLHYIIIIIIKK